MRFLVYLQRGWSGSRLIHQRKAFAPKLLLRRTDDLQSQQKQHRREQSFQVEPRAAGHADRGNDKHGGRAGKSKHTILGMENEAGS